MTLPRWLVVSLLTVSMLAVLSVGAWWWVKWPERTAREFVTALAEGRVADAGVLWQGSPAEFETAVSFMGSGGPRVGQCEAGGRTVYDILLGVQSFNNWYLSFINFEVERGKISHGFGRATVQYFPPPNFGSSE